MSTTVRPAHSFARHALAAFFVVTTTAMLPAADHATGKAGGVLVVAQTSEPKTFNPVMAADQATRDVLSVLSADLVHINRLTLRTEPALAKSCVVSADGRHYTVTLRDGLHFSDGAPITADDVVFSFKVYLDEKVNSPQRDVLIVDDKPISVTKLTTLSVRVDLPAPYAPGDRLFDSFWILPKHKLERAFLDGKFPQAWTVGTASDELVSAGPFRVKQYQPGQRLILERNPYYWKRDEAGQQLPYLDRLDVAFVPDQNAMLLRLLSHEISAASRLRAEDFARLEQTPTLSARDAGAGLEYNFLFFNWSAPAPSGNWFRTLKFRQAVARAIDRESIVRLVYQGRGSSLSSQVTPGNRLWRTDNVSDYRYDPSRAAQLLREAGFRRDGSGPLVDRDGHPVEFSLMVSASNQARRKMATLIQEDLAQVGIRVRLQPTEFGVMTDAVLRTRKFEGALWGIVSGDADPNSEMNVWTSGGTLHVWNLKSTAGAQPLESWENEVDRLMSVQMTATSPAARKSAYDKVQQLVTANVPVVFLASPHVLAAGDRDLGNFEPAATDPVLLWNADRLFWQRRKS
jgi:peptide/nickel transport system substrate-binding protein